MTTTKKISELPDAITLAGTETVPVVQDDATRKATIAQVRAGLALAEHTHVLADISDAGTAASHAATDFATAAQGVKADTALQPDDVGTAAAQDTTAFATAAQGTKADTAVQPGDLGTAASHAAGDFATAAQGAKADSAVQPGALGSAAGHAATDFATATQGAKADSAVQPGALAAVATSGEFGDVLHTPSLALNNAVINGCCRSSQIANVSLSNSWQYGPVDLLAIKAAGTVSAGTIKQNTASTLTATGFSSWIDSATLDSSGAIYFRHRIEAKDCWRFKNNLAYFSCRAYHNAGSAVDFVTTIRKANAADDFSATTDIQTGTQSIASATNSDVTLAVSNMGDCSNGIEIEVKANCGAITAKSFYLGDLQLNIANFKQPFLARPYLLELQLIYRFLRPCYAMHGIANSTSALQLQVSHPGMRTTPTYVAVNKIEVTDGYTADFTQSTVGITSTQENTKDHGRLTMSSFSGMTAGRYYFQHGSDRYVLARCEL